MFSRGAGCDVDKNRERSIIGVRHDFLQVRRFLAGIVLVSACSALAFSRTNQDSATPPQGQVEHLGKFPVIEFRRYTIKEGEREHFAQYFEGYFPEAFEQLGSIVAGSFFERDKPAGFTWIRGFHTMEERAITSGEFYYGPLWREHRKTMNDLIVDSDNVMLLHALSPERSVTILPAMDPVKELDGAKGVVVAQIFAIKPNCVDAFAQQAEPAFAKYRTAGAREVGVLVTLDAANNFPQLPVRADGPFLVWLGLLKDDQELATKFMPVLQQSQQSLSSTELLRATPELIVLHPTHRSRLRWLPER
jgi:hypothetical protein